MQKIVVNYIVKGFQSNIAFLRLLSTAFNNSTKVHLDTEHRPLVDVSRCVTMIITKNGSR